MDVKDVNDSDKYSLTRRCVIIVSGFFLTYLYKGEIYPFYTYPKSKNPFAIAGIYNITHDGFITCSLLLTTINAIASKHHNISNKIPLVISPKKYEIWLSHDYKSLLETGYDDYQDLNFSSHPVAREFYKKEILFESFLYPTDYEVLSIPFSI